MLQDALLLLLHQWGPVVGVVLFFIWRDWKREERLTGRIEAMESYQRDTLVELLKKTTVALTHNAECLKWVGRIIDRVCGQCPHWKHIPEKPEQPE